MLLNFEISMIQTIFQEIQLTKIDLKRKEQSQELIAIKEFVPDCSKDEAF